MVKRSFFILSATKKTVMSKLHTSTEKPMEEIRKFLLKFSGGSIDLIKRPDGIAVITLNQSQKKNAMTGKMMVDLHDIVVELSSWNEGKAILMKGSGHNFCSGGDLDFVRKISTPEEGFMMSTFMQNTLNQYQRLPMISVALVEGAGALGGGAELTVASDFGLIREDSKGIGFVHGKMGIIPAWGGANRLMEKVGYVNALDILSTAKILSPDECLKLNLVSKIIPTNIDAEIYALQWLQQRIKFNVELIKGLKASLSAARDTPRDYKTERQIFAPFWGSEYNKEALQRNIKHKPEDEV